MSLLANPSSTPEDNSKPPNYNTWTSNNGISNNETHSLLSYDIIEIQIYWVQLTYHYFYLTHVSLRY